MASYRHTFVWPHGASHVIVTGTFDDWKSTVTLKHDGSQFSGTVDLPYDSQILYKYVVDGTWTTADSQQSQSDGQGNVNNVLNTPSRPADPKEEPAAPLKDAAEQIEAPNTDPVIKVLEAAGEAVAVAGGAAVAAVASALGMEAASSSSHAPAASQPTEKAADGLPVNNVSSLPAGSGQTTEKPAEPAPSPAVLHDSKSQQSLPTVPSEQDVRNLVNKDSSGPGPVLTGLAPIDDSKSKDENLTSVEAAGKGASTAGPADGAPFMRLTEVGAGAAAGAAAVATGAAAATASKAKDTTTSSSSGAKAMEPVKGVDVYNKDGSIAKDAQIATPSSPKATASTAKEAATDASKKKVTRKDAPPAAKEVPVTPKKEAAKPNGKYQGLGHSKETSKASTVSKKSVQNFDSPANTPAREDYKTAPSTPAPDTPQAAGERNQIPRTTSFFGKIKASLSPSKKK